MQVDATNYKLHFSFNKAKKKEKVNMQPLSFWILDNSISLIISVSSVYILDFCYPCADPLQFIDVQNLIHLGKWIPELQCTGKYLTVFPILIFTFSLCICSLCSQCLNFPVSRSSVSSQVDFFNRYDAFESHFRMTLRMILAVNEKLRLPS